MGSLDIEMFGVQQLLAEIEGEFEPIIAAKNQSFSITLETGDMYLCADRHRTQQVVSNLISNASKYSDPGTSIQLVVSAVSGKIKFVVRDEGIGIAPEYYNQLGTPFFRIDSEHSRKVGGTGLGLYVTKTIVEQHGGTFEISSKLGHGTSVTLSFPAIQKTPSRDRESTQLTYRLPDGQWPKATLNQSVQVHKRPNQI